MGTQARYYRVGSLKDVITDDMSLTARDVSGTFGKVNKYHTSADTRAQKGKGSITTAVFIKLVVIYRLSKTKNGFRGGG